MRAGIAAIALIFSLPWPAGSAELKGLTGGLIARGPFLFCGDEEGMFHLLLRNRPLIHGIGVFSGLNDYTKPREMRKLDCRREEGRVTYRGEVRGQGVTIEQSASVVEGRIRVRIIRTGAWPEGVWGSVQILLPVNRYGGARYRADGEKHTFPLDHSSDFAFPNAMKRLECHLGESELNVVFECEDGLGLGDHRRFKAPFYVVSVNLPKDRERAEVEFFVTLPDVQDPSPGALRYSRIGYPLSGEKVVILEWPRNASRPTDQVRLENRKKKTVKTGRFGETESPDDFQDNFATFDFSSVRVPGEYRVIWSGGRTEWFPIQASVFQERLWHNTLDYFVPFQMCHAEVDLGADVTGHGKCHLDDGARVGRNYRGPDGFVSHECEGTPYRAGEHIALDRGGWHDAGDHDLNVPAQAYTVWMFSLAYDEFGIDRDRGTLDAEAGTFVAGRPDGVPDLVQQIEWGVAWLLSVQQDDGRVYNGVCADAAWRSGKPLEKQTDGEPGTEDDRRVYVDYHADQQLNYAIALAAASRALDKARPELAKRCLGAARAAFVCFGREQEKYRAGSYTATEIKGKERDASVMAAASELYLTTGEKAYLEEIERLSKSLPDLKLDWPLPRATGTGGFRYVAPFLARLYPSLPEGGLKEIVLETCRRAAKMKADRMALRPWPLNIWHSGLWGNSTTALARAFDTYWLTRVAPETLAPEAPLRNMLWVFGLHPTCDTVLVCGLGYPEPRHLYSLHLHALKGYEPSSIPGAVIPGMGGFWYSGVVAYVDEHGYYGHNEACIYTQALYLFAVNAMKAMGF